MNLTSQRPYLIRSIYEWILDNNLTPHLLVNAKADQVEVPKEFVVDGTIVLNILPESIANLELGNDYISFNARFSGVSRELFIPPHAVLGIFAKENNQGMLFADEPNKTPPPAKKPTIKKKVKPTLKIVK